jgi:CheY-like chemotaxis protein
VSLRVPNGRSAARAGAPASVLLCDDEQVLRSLVRATLESDACSIVEAEDGEESIALARSLVPDVVVLDMMMPGRSGLDVLRELRSEPTLAHIPVVMLTARARPADREAAIEAGADRYLAKPFSPLELIAVVEELLETGRS